MRALQAKFLQYENVIKMAPALYIRANCNWFLFNVKNFLRNQQIGFNKINESTEEYQLFIFNQIKKQLEKEKIYQHNDFDFSMFKQFVKEMILAENCSKVDISDYKCLVIGYHREIMKNIKSPMIIALNYLIEKYYYDDCKLIPHPKHAVVIKNNGQTAIIDSNGEEIFDPCYIYWNFALDTESSLTLMIKLKWNAPRGMEGLIIGYFHDNDRSEIQKKTIKYVNDNVDWQIPSTNYEPIFVKGFNMSYAVQMNENSEKTIIDFRTVLPSYLSDTIWDIEYNTYCDSQGCGYVKIKHKGVLVLCCKLQTKDRYILPLFGLLSEKGEDSIQIIQSYIKKK